MGLPGAGKSTVARDFVSQGYARLNRDEAADYYAICRPVSTRSCHQVPREWCSTIPMSRAHRVRSWCRRHQVGSPVRCVWLSTSIEAAQVNAAWRMVSRYGRLLGPDEMRKTVRRDVSAFAPGAQFRVQRELEPPDSSERLLANRDDADRSQRTICR